MIQRPTKLKGFALFKNFSTSFARKNRFIFVEEVRWGVHSEVRPVYGLVFSSISNTNNASSAGVRNADRARS
jgi:hypothetical protein